MLFKNKVTDPVCRMEIKINRATLYTIYQGETFYFCTEDCLTKFKTKPLQYVTTTGSDNQIKDGGYSDEFGRIQNEHQHHVHCNNSYEHSHKCKH